MRSSGWFAISPRLQPNIVQQGGSIHNGQIRILKVAGNVCAFFPRSTDASTDRILDHGTRSELGLDVGLR